MDQDLIQNLTSLVSKAKQLIVARGYNDFERDEQWPSPCETEVDGKWQWAPILQKEAGFDGDFSNVGSALNIKIDQQYQTFFSTYFSLNIFAKHKDGDLELLQAWSEDDYARLQQNLIGHLMMKQRLKQAPTLFFAVTDEEDLNLVVNNLTGEVCLEYVGKEPHTVLSRNLATFLAECEPA